IIMTSNVGATSIRKQNVLGFAASTDQDKEEYERMKETVTEELKKTFRPEFLNRLDEVIVFHSLKEEQVREIVDIMVGDLEKRMAKLDINIKVTENTKEHISKQGFDPVYGARPLERTIRRMIEDQLAEEILRGNLSKEDSIIIEYEDNQLVFKKESL
ncbi:MAG TPA: AAA family ATPase, partial [Tissierellaceae bacterium]|nr:AAA family ATPase [Tissierellaceae bacterium]